MKDITYRDVACLKKYYFVPETIGDELGSLLLFSKLPVKGILLLSILPFVGSPISNSKKKMKRDLISFQCIGAIIGQAFLS